jgi:anti-sigma-K factor RskA
MRSHETFDDLAAVYAVGALDGDDLVRFETHLAEGCRRCADLLRASGEVLQEMALAQAPVTPPPGVRAALLERAAGERCRPGRQRAAPARVVPWLVGSAVIAALVAMLTGGLVAARYEARLGQMARETAAVRERLQHSEASLQEQVQAYRVAIELLRDPATRVVDLHGAGPSPAASGRVIWHVRAGGQLYIANLPPAPAGKAYELWMLGGTAPRAAGTFQVDASGRATHRMEPAAGPAAKFAVTLEPEPGVAAPTGPIVLASP